MKPASPRIHALFQKRIEGDDALLELARLRFREAGLAPEFYASSPDELEWLFSFRPDPAPPAVVHPAVVHLPREINLLTSEGRARVLEFASRFAGEADRFVVHDQLEIATRFEEYQRALTELDTAFQELPHHPCLFIEYAVGLSPDVFCKAHERLLHLPNVSACIDIGHLGIYFARQAYNQLHPSEDICSFNPTDKRLPERIEDVQNAVDNVLPMVLPVVRKLAASGKPLHFHLHDGHPLSTFSPFGVSDHLSFFEKIAIPFEFKGKKELTPMYGANGLGKIVAESMACLDLDRVTFSLEIHPTEGSLPLGNASGLFSHWQVKTNATKMNHWLAVLQKNHRLLSRIINGPGTRRKC